MGKIIFKDQKCLQRMLQVFSEHRQITFEINPDKMRISSLSSPFMYLTAHNDIFTSDGTLMFTIITKELLQSLKLLEADFVLVEDTFKLVKITEDTQEFGHAGAVQTFLENKPLSAYIEIPLIQPIIPFYQNPEKYSTKFFMGKCLLKGLFHGPVTYSNEGNLVVRKSVAGIKEIMEMDVEYLEKGDLYFHSSNDWIANVLPLMDIVSAVLFCFTSGMLTVRIQISDGRGIHLEVQVPERLYVK